MNKLEEKSIDRQAKAYHVTINNPDNFGLDDENIKELVHKTFYKSGLVYWCMSREKGSTEHIHLYVLLERKKRFSSVQRKFCHAHIEVARGTPQQNRDYIRKEGEKYQEKAGTSIEGSFYEEGNIPEFFLSNDKNAMLSQIQNYLDEGLRPEEIMSKHIAFRTYESTIRRQFFAKRYEETPPLRDVIVYWHLGESGSGKTYSYVELCKKYNMNEVFYASDYTNGCTALMDGYEAQKILYLDEVKLDSFKYSYILQMLQGYKSQLHARYSNVYSLYDEVHISSIYTPHELYEAMVDEANRSVDSEKQLLRRISYYVFHWKDENGFHSFTIPSSEFSTYKELKDRAMNNDGFETIDDGITCPFEERGVTNGFINE